MRLSEIKKNNRGKLSKAGTRSIPTKERSGQNGNSKRRSDDRTISGSRFHLLASQLKSQSIFELSLLHGYSEDDQELIDLLDTEAKQLQAISDLYSIVKAQPKYKKLKEPEFTADTAPVIVIQWLLKKLGPLAKGNYWTIDNYVKDGKDRFRFVVTAYYNSQLVKNEDFFIPLNFLPGIFKRDRILHDLIIDVIALVSKHNKIPLWDEDGDFSEAMRVLLKNAPAKFDIEKASQRFPGGSIVEEQQLAYTSGSPAIYLKYIKERRKVVNADSLSMRIWEYSKNHTSARQVDIIWWLKSGINLADTNDNVKNYTYIPNHRGPYVVSPFRRNKFIWSKSEEDIVYTRATDQLDLDARKHGAFIAMLFSITNPGKKVAEMKYGQFPRKLSQFMDRGETIFTVRYRDYFYTSKRATSKLLIDILAPTNVEAEIAHQINITV